MWGRIGIGAVAVVAASIGSVAWAASTMVTSRDVASGNGTVASCDHAPAWTYTFSKDGNGRVDEVTVGNIASACVGGVMRLSLVGPSVSSNGTPTVITNCPSKCSVLVPFPTSLLPSQVTTADGLIVGP